MSIHGAVLIWLAAVRIRGPANYKIDQLVGSIQAKFIYASISQRI